MKNIFPVLMILLVLNLIAGCNSARVVADQAVNTDLSQYETFAYLPAASDMSAEEKAFDYDYSAVLKAMDEIGEEMRAIGYEIDLSHPDLLVVTHVIFSQDATLQREPVASEYFTPALDKIIEYPYYYEGYKNIEKVYGYDIDEVEPEDAALVVDIIDAKTHQLLWRGWVADDFSPEELKDNLRSYVDDIFEEYPVETLQAERAGQ